MKNSTEKENKERYDIVVVSGEWAIQIIASIIGSSLIVTALTLAIPILNRPVISITVSESHLSSCHLASITVSKSHRQTCTQNLTPHTYPHISTKYLIDFKNDGYSQANHVRLTMFYPNVSILNNSTTYKNENMTMKNESQNSVVVFLPRLARGGETKITTTINGSANTSNSNVTGLPDYGSGPAKYYYIHPVPFSIIATYDGGSNLFIPPAFFMDRHQYFDIGNLIILIPIVLGFLAFAIGFRHRRKSRTKFIFDVLNDIKKTKKELIKNLASIEIIYTIKYDQLKEQFFNNYRDHLIISRFYKSLERRDSSLSKNSSDECLLKKAALEQNKECLIQAQEACSKINWRKLYKFDLLTGVPAIIIGSIFLTFVAEGISYFLLWGYGINWLERFQLFPYFTIITFITRSISGFFIVGIILHTTQGIRDYFKYPFSRPITLLYRLT
jgi:hypothetical protein